ncbi:hypothetical protein IMCC26134_05950 [Verrucomicrobia bacterium IMCC26134]|nr:hypothetical protein IMCC26134_05950 [Verrucomicrobia bacterium IMCC26134]
MANTPPIRMRMPKIPCLIVARAYDQREIIAALQKFIADLQSMAGSPETCRGGALKLLLLKQKCGVRSAMFGPNTIQVRLLGKQIIRVHRHQDARIWIDFRNRGGGLCSHPQIGRQINFFKRTIRAHQGARERLRQSGGGERRGGVAGEPSIVMMIHGVFKASIRLWAGEILIAPGISELSGQTRVIRMSHKYPVR